MTSDSVTLIVIAVFAALAAASVIAYTVERSVKTLALKLLEKDIKDENSACTLGELGYTGAALTLTSLCAGSGSRIGRAIMKVTADAPRGAKGDGELLFKAKPPVRYYLPPSTVDKNLKKHLTEQTPFWKLLAALLLLLIASLAASSVIRFLGSLASNVPESFKNPVYGTPTEQVDPLLEEQEKLYANDTADDGGTAEDGTDTENSTDTQSEKDADDPQTEDDDDASKY